MSGRKEPAIPADMLDRLRKVVDALGLEPRTH